MGVALTSKYQSVAFCEYVMQLRPRSKCPSAEHIQGPVRTNPAGYQTWPPPSRYQAPMNKEPTLSFSCSFQCTQVPVHTVPMCAHADARVLEAAAPPHDRTRSSNPILRLQKSPENISASRTAHLLPPIRSARPGSKAKPKYRHYKLPRQVFLLT